ncbi:hypothetical protein GGS20DRAFT_387298 [Poronia punctata]|nr:hypothetical protein GGS20DRAFT_387298 [Poronia punctata]
MSSTSPSTRVYFQKTIGPLRPFSFLCYFLSPLVTRTKATSPRTPLTRRPVFSRVTRSDLPGVRNIWHDKRIDHLELKKLNRGRQNIHLVTCPAFDFPVLVKFAEFPWQMPFFEAETTAYEWIEGKEIGPRFLGHLTEAG